LSNVPDLKASCHVKKALVLFLLVTPFRAVQAEVTQKMNDEETKVQWAVELKQLLANSKAEAKKEFELFSQEYAYVDVESTTAPPSTRTSTKTRKRVDPSGESEETHPKPRPRRSRRFSQQQDAASDDDMDGKYPGKRRRKSEVEPMTH